MVLMTRIGTAFFILWGIVHFVGGLAILAALGEGAASGYATYHGSSGSYDALSGSILGYFAYLISATGVAVAAIALTLNRRNSKLGLAINTAVIAVTEIGLLWFLVVPGFVVWAQASIGLVPFAIAATSSGIACRIAHG